MKEHYQANMLLFLQALPVLNNARNKQKSGITLIRSFTILLILKQVDECPSIV